MIDRRFMTKRETFEGDIFKNALLKKIELHLSRNITGH